MDEAFNDFKRTNNFFLDTGKIIYNLCLGMVEGLKEMLTIPEISAQTAVLIAELGVGITAVTLLAPEVILPILHALASTVGVFFSAYMACVSAGNMYYTATSEADRYEKAKAFGRDGINLIVNVFALKFEVPAAIKDSKKVYNVLSELRHNGYSSLKNPVRLGIISITNLDDFLEVIKGKVSTDAEEYLKRVFSTYDDKMVKDTATVIERAYSHTQTPLNQKSAEKIIDLITHNETGSLDDVVELFKAWAGAGCRSFDEMLAFLNGKADADAISYLKNVRDIYGETLAENAATVVEKVYASCQKPLGKEGIVKIVDALNSSEGKVLDEVADEVADWMIKANQVQELLRRVKGKVDDVAYRYLETAFETQNISMSEEIVITIEKVYDSVKKPLNKENAEKLIGMLANKQGKTLDDVAEEMVQVIKGGKYTEAEIQSILENIRGDGFKNNPLRQAYENEVAGLKSYGEELLASGMPEEEVARTLNQARRDLGVKYKDMTPQPLRDYIYEVNTGRYGDKLGPTYEWLVEEKGATNAEIIESASRPNSNIDKLLARFEEWLREQ